MLIILSCKLDADDQMRLWTRYSRHLIEVTLNFVHLIWAAPSGGERILLLIALPIMQGLSVAMEGGGGGISGGGGGGWFEISGGVVVWNIGGCKEGEALGVNWNLRAFSLLKDNLLRFLNFYYNVKFRSKIEEMEVVFSYI